MSKKKDYMPWYQNFIGFFLIIGFVIGFLFFLIPFAKLEWDWTLFRLWLYITTGVSAIFSTIKWKDECS